MTPSRYCSLRCSSGKNPAQYVISVIDHRRLPRKTVYHSVQINRKRDGTHQPQPQCHALWTRSLDVSVSKEPAKKQNPQRRRGVEAHPPCKPSCQDKKYRARHAAARAGKACQYQLRAECVKHYSGHCVVQSQRQNRAPKIPEVPAYPFYNNLHLLHPHLPILLPKTLSAFIPAFTKTSLI